MSKRMLIDAAHAEETRVVVLDGTRVEEFDFESRNLKQLRGNIYLAKVIRVEPSLQAAFVEYGGNRHGFLAFNEIHPDYFQIPHADREALMREAAEDEDEAPAPAAESSDEESEDGGAAEDDEDVVDAQEERRRRRLMRRYKIQEVIRRRQIMLVQVVKEERGNKGAALTTYLSLAGRYGVLMPNTDRGGGISRKITTATDRKRLKSVVQSLGVPKGMGLIVRTAGAKRTKAEIKRDYDYLVRLWESIRETTLHSIAPALIYEEEDLVKRAIRDLYDKDLEGIWVEGDAGYREARDFMRMLMPSQAKKVQPYTEATPLFVRHRIEDALAQIYSPVVPLKSGGYLVINQTEALVAIDVNSGRATRERNIEATALKTNMEAAEEAARQLRLRDLAGLIVIDFIDMDESKNNRAVEKKLKDCLEDDRARVQMGRISSFGLMEISRQRRRTGVLEGTTMVCPHCAGIGRVRTVESAALGALRAVEGEAIRGGGQIVLKAAPEVALYILNHKRDDLARIRQVHGLFVSVAVDDTLAQEVALERLSSVAVETVQAWAPPSAPTARADYVAEADAADEDVDDDIDEDEDDEDEAESARPGASAAPREDSRRDDEGGRGRRRRRRGRRDDARSEPATRAESAADDGDDGDESGGDAESRRRRRRGRRGGRRIREEGRPLDVYAWSWPARSEDPYQWRGPAASQLNALAAVERAASPEPAPVAEAPADTSALAPSPVTDVAPATAQSDEPPMDVWVELPPVEDKPKRARRSRGKAKAADVEADVPAIVEAAPEAAPETAPEATEEPVVAEPVVAEPVMAEAELVEAPAPEAAPAAPEPQPEPEPQPVAAAPAPEPEPAIPDPAEIVAPPAAPKRGWWRRG